MRIVDGGRKEARELRPLPWLEPSVVAPTFI
jgi:hypothetical protein